MSRTITQLLRESTVMYPDRIAVEDHERGNGITYRELSSRAEEVRDALLRHGLRPGDRVGLLAPKSIGLVAAIFGILDAGAAYVPADPGAPPPRNAAILMDCSISYAIMSATLFESLSKVWTGEPLQVAENMGDDLLLLTVGAKREGDRERIDVLADPVAYILYTSGSTGHPKGVVHTQSSALSFIDWCSATFAPTEQDRFSAHAPFHFDLSIFDLYVPIKHGATVVLIGAETGKQPKPLASLIAEQRLTVWYSTPSVLRVLAEYGHLDQLDCSALRFVIFAGEVFPVRHIRELKKFWAAPRYFNLYGPTETNVCTAYELPPDIPDDRTEPYPIGFPCSGDRAMVVDENDMEVERGAEGELVISGASVMREYWNLPERTSESFLVDQSGVKWYRTGDVVRQLADGGYVYCGRRDRMVKRRGYRVELGEIESALYRHPLVAEAAVVASKDVEDEIRITAFLTLSNGSRPSVVEMKRFCMEQLPVYMIPDRFTVLTSLARTSTHKIDYQRLGESA